MTHGCQSPPVQGKKRCQPCLDKRAAISRSYHERAGRNRRALQEQKIEHGLKKCLRGHKYRPQPGIKGCPACKQLRQTRYNREYVHQAPKPRRCRGCKKTFVPTENQYQSVQYCERCSKKRKHGA